MKAKDKAKELFDKMYLVDDTMGNYPMCFDTAKQCALIAVDEIIEAMCEYHLDWEYYHEVKQEIQAL